MCIAFNKQPPRILCDEDFCDLQFLPDFLGIDIKKNYQGLGLSNGNSEGKYFCNDV